MNRGTTALAAALVVSNAAWAAYVLSRPSETSPEGVGVRPPAESTSGALPPRPAAVPGTPPLAPTLAKAPPASDAVSLHGAGLRPTPESERAGAERRAEQERSRVAATAAESALAAEKAAQQRVVQDVVQIEDAGRRARGLHDLEESLRSPDPVRATAAMRVLPRLDAVEYDREGFRTLLLPWLRSPDAAARSAAAFALPAVKADPRDLDAYLDALGDDLEAIRPHAYALLTLNGRKVDGRVADLFVRLLATTDRRKAIDTANVLRGVPSTLEVQQAAVAAWKRHQESGEPRGLWFHILGQLTPRREPALRAAFDVLAAPDAEWDGGLLTHRLTLDVAPEDRPLAAMLASQALTKSPHAQVRGEMLGVLAAYGTREQADVVREFANNALVPAAERERAKAVLAKLESR